MKPLKEQDVTAYSLLAGVFVWLFFDSFLWAMIGGVLVYYYIKNRSTAEDE